MWLLNISSATAHVAREMLLGRVPVGFEHGFEQDCCGRLYGAQYSAQLVSGSVNLLIKYSVANARKSGNPAQAACQRH